MRPRMTIFSVPDMSCGHCRARVEKAIKGVDAGAEMSFDMAARRVDVESAADNGLLQSALKDAGYVATAL